MRREQACWSGTLDKIQLLTKRTELNVSIRDPVRTTLRLRPDRILAGEIRDGAKRLLQVVFGLSIAVAMVSFSPQFFSFAGAATFDG